MYVLFVVIVVAATNEDYRTNDCSKIAKDCGQHPRCLEVINSEVAQQIPYPEDCHKFYKCAAGKAYLLCCPLINPNGTERLVFNPELQVCDWPQNVKNPEAKCDSVNPIEPTTTPTESTTTTTESTTTTTESTKTTTESTTTTTKPTVPSNKDCLKNETKLIEYEPDCTKYYRCINGTITGPYLCYQGHVFNPKIGGCDRKENYECPHPTPNLEYFDNSKEKERSLSLNDTRFEFHQLNKKRNIQTWRNIT